MKILIICSNFHPIQSPRSFRSTELAKEFSRQGHEVTILTPRNDQVHDQLEKKYGIRIKDLGNVPTISRTHSTKGLLHWILRVRNRLLQVLFEYPEILFIKCVREKLKKEKGYDLLISVAVPYPIHWGVASIWDSKMPENNPARIWVADCGDPFMQNKHDTFKKMFYFHLLENNFLKKANFITVPFQEMQSLFNAKYAYKFRVIPQGFKFKLDQNTDYEPNHISTFIYSGAIIPGYRDPFSLIDFLENENTNYRFIIYTRQPYLFDRFKPIIGQRLFLKDYIPREKLIKELSMADFLINVNTDSNNGVINAIPTKLIDYRISGRPILSYEQNKLPTEAINEFLSGNYQKQFIDTDFDRYKIENVTQKFLDLVPN